MDSTVVNKEIKSRVRPLLEDVGLSQFTARTAWRYSPGKIDVLTFQSFNSYLADAVGCTTYSFCIRLGCSLDAIPRYTRAKRKNGYLRPEAHECHLRFTLQKSIKQSNLKRRDVWYVDPTGNNLAVVIADARKAILETGLNWFTRFQDQKEVLRTLLEDSEAHEGTHGFGANPSPMRHFMTGFSALSLGQISVARKHLQQALDSRCFKEFQATIHSTLEGIDKEPS